MGDAAQHKKAREIIRNCPPLVRDMRNSSDMVFVCSDGVEVPALRKLVAARSPVLRSMLLTSGMAEATLSRVPLPTIGSSVMNVCMEYLYTGLVGLNSWPRSLLDCMRVTSAARFFLVPKMEKWCINHCMCMQNFKTKDVLQAYNIGTELYYGQPCKDMSTLLNRLLKEIEPSLRSAACRYQDLSKCSCLQMLQTFSHVDPLSHYHLLLHAMRWCASRVSNSEALQKVLDCILPWSLEDKLPLLELEYVDTAQSAAAADIECIKLLAEPLESLLGETSFDLSKVPPVVVIRMLEPLGVLLCSRVLGAYRTHALLPSEVRWSFSGLRSGYSISKRDPSVIVCTNEDAEEGYAECNNMPSNFVYFEWEICILNPCDKLIVGCCNCESGARSDSSLLGEESGTVALILKGRFDFDRRRRHSFVQSAENLGASINKGTKVRMLVHIPSMKCIFKVDGREIWKTRIRSGLNGKIFPAIAMQKPGRVQVSTILYV